MRKIIISSFASLFLLASCNDSDKDYDNLSSDIKLNAKVESRGLTKSGPINSTFTTDFPAGIYAYNTGWLAGAAANIINNDNATVAGAGTHNVLFGAGPYYYPTNGSLLHFFAFAPQATESTPAGAGTSPVVSHTINGQQDVMWASATGYKSGSTTSAPVLAFQHKLTQLQFTLKADITYPTATNSVVSLQVKSQPNNVNMVVETGACTFSGTADMEAISVANQTAGISIIASGANANSPVMTNALSSYLLTVVVKQGDASPSVTYSNIPLSLAAVQGNAHMVTLTFTATSVTATATVAPWVNGIGASVTL